MGKSLKIIFLLGCFLLTGFFKAKAAMYLHNRTAIFKHAASVPSSVATLSNITISQGTLSPVFSSGVFFYADNVAYSTTSVTLSPTTTDPTATVTVNGAPVISGQSSAAIPLNVGQNNISVVVTAQDGVTVDTYTVTVTEAPSSDATLSNLSTSAKTLSPAFSQGVFSYTDNVSNGTSSVTLTPFADNSGATITVNGVLVVSGQASAAIPINVGQNNISVVVTAQDDVTVDTYTVTVIEAPSSDAALSSLSTSAGTMSPAFSSGVFSYTDNVVNGTSSVTLTPAADNSAAGITINGVQVISGQESAAIPLNAGQNNIPVVVTAQDGVTIDTYTVTITEPPSTDAALANMTISQGTLSPAFSSGGANYTSAVTIAKKPHSVYTTGDSISASNGYQTTLDSLLDNLFYFINMSITSDTTGDMKARFPTIVNAGPDYVIIMGGVDDLRRSFNAPYIESNLEAMYAAAHSAGIKVIALTVTPFKGNISWSAAKQASQDSVNRWIATAPDVDYVIDTYNALLDPSNPYQMLPLYDSGDHLHPGTAGQTKMAQLIYQAVPFTPNPLVDQANATNNSLMVTPQADNNNATITVNGQAVISGTSSAPVPLSVGSNAINTQVTAQDGVTTETYALNVTGKPASDANLANMYLVPGGITLSPYFATNITAYTASIPYNTEWVTMRATTEDPAATITVNGKRTITGQTSAVIFVKPGINTVTVVVTAQDGVTRKTYTIAVGCFKSTNAQLNLLTISNGPLSPTFAAGTTSYSESVAATVKSATVTAFTSDSTATLTINGKSVASGAPSAPISFIPGKNTIPVVITAQDGVTTDTYTITVFVGSNNASLSNLALSGGTTLNPAFHYTTYVYSATVPNTTTSITVTPSAADATATITVNGIVIITKTASAPIPLVVGPNVITVVDAAQNGGLVDTYTVTVTRAPSSIATLSALAIGSGTLSPAFASGINSYTASVLNSVTSISLTPVTSDQTATVTVNGTPVTSGMASGLIPLNVGNNTVSVAVTAQDGVTVDSYAVVISRLSSIATLSALTISSGALSPVFDGGTTSYTVSVPDTVTSMDMTPVTTDPTATVMLNGILVTSGIPSGAIALNLGSNTISVVVTAQDGVTIDTYSVMITRVPSSIATLSALQPDSGLLSPAFASTTIAYTENVSNAINSISLTPAASDPVATIQVNGIAVASGTPSPAMNLNVGQNVITTVVTASDGVTTDTYTTTVTRPPSSNANLSNITLSAGALSPAFLTGTNTYTALVPNSTSAITVTPSAVDSTATITINGAVVASNAASTPIALIIGQNTVTISVTAQDGVTTQTYSLVVMRPLSSVATLSAIKISGGPPLSPVFAGGTTNYTANVASTVTYVTLTPTLSDATAIVKVNGTAVTSGTPSRVIPVTLGANTITTVVTAQDGVTTIIYTVTVYVGSNNASLSNLMLSGATALSPAFHYTTYGYTATVPNTTTAITATPSAADATATITVNGTAVATKTASGLIPLVVGPNVISTVVTAQNGLIINTYTITVTRAPSGIATLSALAISGGTLSPAFSSGTTSYMVSVPNSVSSVALTPSPSDLTATVVVNGTSVTLGTTSSPISLNVGNNIILTVVTAQDGVTVDTYSVTVNRAPSSIATLSALAISNGTLSPVFAGGADSYTDTVLNAVTAVTLTPVTSDPTATVTVNGTILSSGTPSAPIAQNVGSNLISVVVTAQDGVTVNAYTVTVTRPPSSVATLSALQVNSGALSPVFMSGISSYTDTVDNATLLISVSPVTTDPTATIEVNGTVVTSGTSSPAIGLNVGQNVITTLVTAQDGVTTDTYTTTVTRAPSSNANLSNLTLSAGALSPAFLTGTNTYTALVPNSTSAITVTPSAADPTATITVNGAVVASNAASTPIALALGANTITISAMAQDGITSQTYSVVVTRPLSSIATLSAIKISGGPPLSPVFAGGTTNYTANVASTVTYVTLTPTLSDATAIVKVNGTAVTSGTPSRVIPVTLGANTITTVVTAQDGVTTTTYTVTVYVGSNNASLSNLVLSGGLALNPAFQYATYGYTATVSNATSSITVTPTAADATATITVNGTPVISKTASGAIPLAFGQNTITTVITAQNGLVANTYTVTITRPLSTIATLSGLKISTGTLSPVFAAGTNNYTTSLAATVASITLMPTTTNGQATVTINGQTVTSASASAPISLNSGMNVISTVVTAQDGVTTDTYTLTVYKGATNAALANLYFSSGPALNPAFKYTTTGYTAGVTNTVASVSIIPTTADANATVTVNGWPAVSKAAYGPIALAAGVNTITVIVTAQNGLATDTYTVAVTRAAGGSDGYNAGISVINPTETPLLAEDGIVVHKGVSPNGDGIDDILTIDNISSYPDNKLMIMNRNGQLVFEIQGYNNISRVFDGHSNKNGQMQLPGTYFYELDYVMKGVAKHKTGFLVLKY